MKALVYEGPETLVYREADGPIAGNDEAIVRVEAVGICGSDMHAYLGHDARRPAPLILGHEAAGMIEGGPRDGERVTVNPLVTCGTCRPCREGRSNLCADRQILSMAPRQGAFAERLAVPYANLVTVPDEISLVRASLVEPLACGWHAVRLVRQRNEDALRRGPCVVIGGGAIGLGAALALRAAGAERVMIAEPNALRRAVVEQTSGFETYDPTNASPANDGAAPVVIDGVGYASTRATACKLAAPGGIILHIGLGEAEGGVDVRRLTLQEITFTGTYTYTPKEFRQTAKALFDGRLGSLDWIERRPLRDGAQAFKDIRAGRVAAPKIVLEPARR